MKALLYLLYIAVLLAFLGCTASVRGKADNDAQPTIPVGAYDSYDSLARLYGDLPIRRLVNQADTEYMKGRVNTSMTLCRVALSHSLKYASHGDSVFYIRALCNLGYMWWNDKHNPEQAHSLFMQALCLIPTLVSNGITTGQVYNNIGQLYMFYRDMPRAFEFNQKGFREYARSRNPDLAYYSYIDLVQFAWLFGYLDKIRPDFKLYRQSARETEYSHCGTLETDAALAYLNCDYTRSLELLSQATDLMAEEKQIERDIIINRIIMARVSLLAGKPELAKAAIDKAEHQILNVQNSSDLIDLYYSTLTDYYRASGNSEMARHCKFRSMEIRDSLLNVQQYGKMRDIESAWKASDYDSRLRQANEGKDEETRERKRQTQVSIIAIIAALLTGLALAFAIRRNKQLDAANRELFRKNMQLVDATAPQTIPANDNDKETRQADAEMEAVFDEVKRFFSKDQSIFDPDFSIYTMARSSGLQVKKISEAINTITSENFNTYLADFRIRRACQMLVNDKGQQPMTVEAVAEAVGYRSRSHFSKIFKAVTGMTPSMFVKQAQSSTSHRDNVKTEMTEA